MESTNSISLRKLQADRKAWSDYNFGQQPSYHYLLGAIEELGELSHAHLKGEQGIRHGKKDIFEMKMDAVADIIIFLAGYCQEENIDMEGALNRVWSEVRKRDWIKYSETGMPPVSAAAIKFHPDYF